jgi:hypothetical protein
MKKRNRLLLGTVLAAGLALCCLLLGMFVAGKCCVPEGSGLAGPGIVLGWGLLAGTGGLIAGGVLGFTLPPRPLRIAAAAAGLGGTVVLALLVIATMKARSETQAHLESAYDRLPGFVLELVPAAGAEDAPFERFSVNWEQREATIVIDGETCRAPVTGEQAVALLGAIRTAEGVLYPTPDPCPRPDGPGLYRLRFVVTEGLPPQTRGEVAPDAACLQQWPALDAPMAEAKRQLRSLRRRCTR